jgi:hypothetical protein
MEKEQVETSETTEQPTNKKKRLAEKQQRRETVDEEEEKDEEAGGTWVRASDEVIAARRKVKPRRSKEPKEIEPAKFSIPAFPFENNRENKTEPSKEEKDSSKEPPKEEHIGTKETTAPVTQEEKTEVGNFVVVNKEDNAAPPTSLFSPQIKPLFSSTSFTFDPKLVFSNPQTAPSSTPSILFGNAGSTGNVGNPFGGGGLTNSNASSTNSQKDEEGGEEEGEQPKEEEKPSLAENSTTGEEGEDNLIQVKGKLFVYDKENTKWKERGTGICRLNQAKDKSYSRLIFREEKVRRILLNFRLSPVLNPSQNKNAITFLAPNVDDPKKIVTYSIKITEKPNSEQSATKLIELINQYKSNK